MTTITAINKRYFILGLSVAGAAFFLDQLCKYIMLYVVNVSSEPTALGPFFNLVMVWNKGISFGMFSSHDQTWQPYALMGVSLLIVGILFNWLRTANNNWVAAAIGMVIGGALGNVVDRLRYGAVADFFDFHALGYHWPAFNIADSLICIGVAILCWDSIFPKTHADG